MDTLQASTLSTENVNQQNGVKLTDAEINMAKLELLVTPEQVFSASVARKRRNLSKKHREKTPVRDARESSDEEIPEQRPKTPERKRRKSRPRITEDDEKIKNEQSKQIDVVLKAPKNELIALFNKAKKSLVSGRDRARHRNPDISVKQRSQSVPTNICEDDLLERLKTAKLIDNKHEASSSDEKFKKPLRPVVRKFLANRQNSCKIIEILDPKTSKILKKITKGPEFRMTLTGFYHVFRYVSLCEMFKIYRVFKRDHKSECDKIHKLKNRCITNIMLILIFCGLGGIMFKFVEGAFESFYKCGVKRVKRDFIDVLWYRSHNLREEEWKSLARNRLRTFEEELHSAHEAGMHSYSGQRAWSFLNGVTYCLTIVTTIGYGHMYPTTTTGQALTIVYSIIGIPLFLIALTDFGKLFTRAIKFVWSFVRRVYYTGSCRNVRKTAQVAGILQGAQRVYEIATLRRPSMFYSIDQAAIEVDAENPKTKEGNISAGTNTTPTTPAPSNFEIDDEFNLPISVAIFILVLYIFLGAVMYCLLEQWNFFSAFYFVFISMSTIGFGDYVPRNPVCMLASIFYLVFGLALMSMCINVVQVKLSDTFKDASSKLGATIGINVNSDDGSIATVSPGAVELPDLHVPKNSVTDTQGQLIDIKKDNGKKLKSSLKTKSEEDGDSDGEKLKTSKVTF